MNPHKLSRPVWQQGFQKRKWLLVCLFMITIFGFGLRQYTVSWQPTARDETDSLEYLTHQINKEDSFFSNNWRRFWPQLPGVIQTAFKNWRPALPARAQRIYACKRLRFHGHEAIPPLLSKLKGSDPETVEAAMASLMEINIPTDKTWEQIMHIIEDQNQSDFFRLAAFHVLIAIHHQEERSSVFFNQMPTLLKAPFG